MSQYGAGFLAAQGSSYGDILRHYYTGITLGTMPITVDTSAKTYKINFAGSERQKYYLKFENTKRLSGFDFTINSTTFNPDMSTFEPKVLSFDITKYLNQNGINEILISPLPMRDRGKSTRVWVEVQ